MALAKRQTEEISWTDARSGHTHTLREEGHLFCWTSTYTNEEDEAVAMDYGLVPGGIYVAVYNLLR